MKVGDLVTNIVPLRYGGEGCYGFSHSAKTGHPPPIKQIVRGSKGVILAIHQTDQNGEAKYIDVLVFDDGIGKPWKAGNFHSASFSKIV
jgi:hypothetical protein